MDAEIPSSAAASSSLPDDGSSPATIVDRDDDDATEVISNVAHHRSAATTAPATMSSAATAASSSGLFANLRKFFNPRATDIQQLLNKLQTQFKMLEFEHKKFMLSRTRSSKIGSSFIDIVTFVICSKALIPNRLFHFFFFSEGWDAPSQDATPAILDVDDILNDPKHPMNNPKLITEVHFVGRKATDPSIIDLTSLLMNHDTFGSITELWLNQNLISDDGASAIASYLQSPTCALVELWLGENQIGPVGTALISASLSNNSNTKLKCLGLYSNPIGNGGAMTLAQMLRKNHVLTTVDVHGCGRRGGSSSEVLEGYGCKVIKARDGTEYVARVVAPLTEEYEGLVTDQRLLDAIQTYAAFNRINPTREQIIRGFTDSKKPNSQVEAATKEGEGDEEKKQSMVAKFLSELGSQPASETLTDDEKQTWKDCEWDRLYVEIERARAAKLALANLLEIKDDTSTPQEERDGLLENDGVMEKRQQVEVSSHSLSTHFYFASVQSHTVCTYAFIYAKSRRDLDDEVVYTDSRSWRHVKMGITGSPKPTPRQSEATADSTTLNAEHESFAISGDSVDEVKNENPTHGAGESENDNTKLCSESNLELETTEENDQKSSS
jgi:hypothetical protein